MKKVFSVLITLTLILSSMSFVFADSLENGDISNNINQKKIAFTDAQIYQMINDPEMNITKEDISRMENYNQMTADYANITPYSSGGKTLSITLYQQPTSNTCGPASAQMVLKFLQGIKYPIAGDLDSITGASSDAVAACLNNKLNKNTYTFTNVKNNPNALFTNTMYSIDASKPVIYNILPSTTLLPNYVGYTGNLSGHYIVGYGYSWGVSGSVTNSTVYYADPHYSSPYGKYQTSVQNMSTVVTNRNGYMVTAV